MLTIAANILTADPASEAQIAVIVAILGALGTFITVLVSSFGNAKRSELDAMNQVITSLQTESTRQAGVISNLQTENNTLHAQDVELQKQLAEARAENKELRARVDALTAENVALRAELADYKAGKRKQTGAL